MELPSNRNCIRTLASINKLRSIQSLVQHFSFLPFFPFYFKGHMAQLRHGMSGVHLDQKPLQLDKAPHKSFKLDLASGFYESELMGSSKHEVRLL